LALEGKIWAQDSHHSRNHIHLRISQLLNASLKAYRRERRGSFIVFYNFAVCRFSWKSELHHGGL
jgi:hypothetical protein